MIKLKTAQRLVRETTAAYETNDEKGELTTQTIRVRYWSLSIREMKEQRIALEAMFKDRGDDIIWLSDTLPYRVESLPDIEGLDGKPIKTEFDTKGKPTKKTTENFEAIARHNLAAIDRAITEDLTPKDQASK